MKPKSLPALCQNLPQDAVYSVSERRFWPQATHGEAAAIRTLIDQVQHTCGGQAKHVTWAYYKDGSNAGLAPDEARTFIKDLKSGTTPQGRPLNRHGMPQVSILAQTSTLTAALPPISISTDGSEAVPVRYHTVAEIQLGPFKRHQEIDRWKLQFLNPQQAGGSLKIDGHSWGAGETSPLLFITGKTETYSIFEFDFDAGLQKEGAFDPHHVGVTLIPATDARRMAELQEKIETEQFLIESAPIGDFRDTHLKTLAALQVEQDDAKHHTQAHQLTIKAGKLLKMQDIETRSKNDVPECKYSRAICRS